MLFPSGEIIASLMLGAVSYFVTRVLFQHLHTRLRRDLSVAISCLVFSVAPVIFSGFNVYWPWQIWMAIWLIVGLLSWGKRKTLSGPEPVWNSQNQLPHLSLSSVGGTDSSDSGISTSSHFSISPMPLSDCKPGEWYLAVNCHHCGTRSLLPDLSDGKSTIDAVYTWRCPVCEHVDQREGKEVERYQHPLRDSAES